MPVSGIVCGHDGSYQSFDSCITCHQNRGPRNCHFPTFALKIMRDNDRKRVGAGYSATTLLNCPRAVALLEQYDYYEDLESGWNKIRGELIHMAYEAEPDIPQGVIKEQRLRKTVLVDGVPINVTGKADEIDVINASIIDLKFTGVIPEQDKVDHIAQYNIYAWLCDGGVFIRDDPTQGIKAGDTLNLTIKNGGMHYLTLKRKKKRDGRIILPWRKVAYPLWDAAKTEALVIERLTPLVRFRQTRMLPTCNPYYTERHWTCDCSRIEKQLTDRGISIVEEQFHENTVG